MQITYEIKKNIDTEANRFFFILNQILIGFYQDRRIPISTSLHPGKMVVVLPKLDFDRIPGFPTRFLDEVSLGLEDTSVIGEVSALLQDSLYHVRERELNNSFVSSVIDEFAQFTSTLFQNLPEKLHYEIYETDIGTVASWGKPREVATNSFTIRIFIRSDVVRSNLAEALLSPLVAHIHSLDDEKFHWVSDWKRNEAIVDFLLTKTNLATLSEGFMPTSHFEDDVTPELAQESSNYYKEIGYPILSKFQYLDESVSYDGEVVGGLFTESEHRVLTDLIIHKGNVREFDDLAKAFWQEDATERFSLEAIAKIIQKIRDKFELFGASRSFILTKRGVGYMFWD